MVSIEQQGPAGAQGKELGCRGALWRAEAPPSAEDHPWVWLGVITVLAAGLRFAALNQQLWYDEIVMVVNSVRRPLIAILTQYTTQNQHTLYSILARAAVALFGEQPWALRLPAVLFGVASVPALYFFAQQITTRREALLASALMAVSYHHVWFSQNARGYTALLFFTLLASYYFIRGLTEPTWGAWIGYSLSLALGMYIHLTMGLVAVGHALLYLWLLATRGQRSPRWPRGSGMALVGFFSAGVLTLLLYLPLLPQILGRTLMPSGPAVHWEWKKPLWLARETLHGLEAGAGGQFVAVAVVGLVALLGLASYWRRNRYGVVLVLLPCALTAAVMLVLEHNLWPRFFFFALGFAILIFVRGIVAVGQGAAKAFRCEAQTGLGWGTGLALLAILGSVFTLPPAYRYPKQDFISAMRMVEAQRQLGEPVVTVGLTAFAYRRYFGRDWPAVETVSELESLRAQGRPVWLVYAFPIYLQGRYPEVWSAIQRDFRTVGVFRGTLGAGEIYVAEAGPREAGRAAAK